jgi:probable F420-dependent oxidoreductase
MDFGVVMQCTPPAARVVDLARKAETYGFKYVWTFDSHILWEEPYVIYSKILNDTRNITIGPMVTNPATRDITVTASVFATLNEMYGNRTVIGIGRGDSAVRVTNGKPVTVAELRDSVVNLKALVNGESVNYHGNDVRLPWAAESRTPVWVAAYGPKVLALTGEVGDGFILQLADPAIAEWTIKAVKDAAKAAGRDPDAVKICVAAPAYVTEDIAHARDQLRWFGGMVGNHVADIVDRYGHAEEGGGEGGGAVPQALTDYIKGRKGYDYNDHGQAGNTHADFVPDEIIDRFCIIGPPEEQIRRLEELKSLGVDQFALYLQHDDKDHTLAEYGEKVIPAVSVKLKAKE